MSEPLKTTPWEGGRGRREYRSDLAQVDTALVELVREVVVRIAPATEATLADDDSYRRSTGPWYDELEGRCARLEDDCFVLVARQAPVAADLREIFAVMRSVHEVRRAGKLLRHITETLAELGPIDLPDGLRARLIVLAEGAQRLVTAGVTAWEERDGLAVNELEEMDDEVDRRQERLVTELHLADHEPDVVAGLALVARWYERIADHGVEIARHVSWAVTGDRVDRDGRA